MDRSSLTSAPARLPQADAVLELLKPLTWFAPMWAFGCGLVSSGQNPLAVWPAVLGGLALAGPLVCGASQAVNDWYDRHVDSVNEPERPIPSGRVPGAWGLYLAMLWTLASIFVAGQIGPWVFGATVLGLGLAWAYSAPPLRLKRSGVWGPLAVGFSYEGLAWFTGAAVASGGLPDWRVVVLAVLYSLGAHGIMTLNDFKAMEGDRATGLRSLPVVLGAPRAARVACWVMALPQVVVVALLAVWDLPLAAAAVALLLAVQLVLMRRLLQAPRERAPWYNATGTTLYVLGMLASAVGVGYGLG